MYDFAIIGGGIAGLSLASELVKQGSVLLLEQETLPGYHATGRSIATIMPNYGNASIRKLNRASLAWFASPPLACDEPFSSPRGLFVISRQDDHLRHMQYSSEAYCLHESSTIDLQTETGFVVDKTLSVTFEPEVQDLNVHAMLSSMVRHTRGLGGVVEMNQRVKQLDQAKGYWNIQTSDTRFQAHIIVNCAGAWADLVGAMAGCSPRGLQPLLRSVGSISAPQGYRSNSPMVMDAGGRFYCKPDAGQLTFSPLDEKPIAAGDAFADDLQLARGLADLHSYLGIEASHLTHRRGGIRTFAPDRSLQIGYDPRVENFFWLVGQGGYGIQSCPAAVAVAVHRLLLRAGPAEFGGYRWTDKELAVATPKGDDLCLA